MAAYWHRLRSGQGQAIDISIQECLTAFFELSYINYTYSGAHDTRATHKVVSPWNIVRAGDGFIYFCCGEQDQWLRLVELMGNPEWAREERFKDGANRGRNAKELRALMEQWAHNWTFQDLYVECVETADSGRAAQSNGRPLRRQNSGRARLFRGDAPPRRV